MGQGSDTAMAQMVGEVLDIPAENVNVVLVVPDPGDAEPAVSVVWRGAAPLQLAASTEGAPRPSPRAARIIARAMTWPPPRTPMRFMRGRGFTGIGASDHPDVQVRTYGCRPSAS